MANQGGWIPGTLPPIQSNSSTTLVARTVPREAQRQRQAGQSQSPLGVTPTESPAHTTDTEAELGLGGPSLFRNQPKQSSPPSAQGAAYATLASSHRIQHDVLTACQFTFNMPRFLLLFAVLSCGPLMCLLPRFYGKRCSAASLRALQVHPGGPTFWITVWLFFSTIFLAGLLVFLHDDLPSVHTISLMAVVAAYFVTRVVLAAKYAYMPPSTFMSWVDGTVSPSTAVREDLLEWMTASESHLSHEIAVAASQLGVGLSSSFQLSDGSELPLHNMLHAIIVQARRDSWDVRLRVACAVAAVSHATYSCGLFDMVLGQLPWPGSALEVLADIVLFINGFGFAYTLLAYGCCCFVDYQRRHLALIHLQNQVSHTVRSDHMASPQTASPPKVSLLVAENAHMFLVARRLLLNVGLRYWHRLQQYTSAILVVIAVVAALMVSSAMNGWLKIDVTTIQISSDAALMLLIMVACIVMGSMTNSLAAVHLALVDARRLEAGERLMEAKLAVAEGSVRKDEIAMVKLEQSVVALRGVREVLRHDDELRSIQFIGMRATPGLIQAVVLSSLSIISFVSGLL